jgi:hypothetical protein
LQLACPDRFPFLLHNLGTRQPVTWSELPLFAPSCGKVPRGFAGQRSSTKNGRLQRAPPVIGRPASPREVVAHAVRILNEAGIHFQDGPGYYIRDGIVIVPKNGVLPDGTVV